MSNTTTTAQLLANLNTIRTDLGMSPLKAWKESRAKLEAAIAKLADRHDALLAEVKAAEAAQRLVIEAAAAKVEQAKPAKAPKAKPVTPEAIVKSAKVAVEVIEPTTRTGEFADWCRANGFNPKVARAKLRKAGHKRDGARYVLNDAAIAIVKGK